VKKRDLKIKIRKESNRKYNTVRKRKPKREREGGTEVERREIEEKETKERGR